MLVACCAVLGFLCISLWLLSFRRPGYIFGLVATQFGVEQLFQTAVPIFVSRQEIYNIAIGIAALTTVAFCWYTGRVKPGFGNLGFGFLIFTCYALLSVGWTPDLQHTIDLLTIFFPYLLLCSVVGPQVITKPTDFEDAIKSIWALTFALAIGSMFAPWSSRGLMSMEELSGNPLAIATNASLLSISSLIFLLSINANFAMRTLFVSGVILGLYICYSTGSRGQMIAALAVMILMTLHSSKRFKTETLFSATIGVLLLMVFKEQFLSLFSERWDITKAIETVSTERSAPAAFLWEFWSESGSIFSLFFGFGLGSSYHYINNYPHFVLLETITELGLLGITIYSLVLIQTGRKLLENQKIDNKNGSFAMFSIIYFLLFFFLLSFKQGSLLGSFEFFGFLIIASRLNARSSSADIKSLVADWNPPHLKTQSGRI